MVESTPRSSNESNELLRPPIRSVGLFPGQASQVVGMGRSLYEHFPVARQTYNEALTLLPENIAKISFEGPKELLDQTSISQPAILTHGVSLWRVMQGEAPQLIPDVVAGNSFGEYTALVAAGVLSFHDALLIARERGRLMEVAGRNASERGGMGAILPVTASEVAPYTDDETVVIANIYPEQVVVSGYMRRVQEVLEHMREYGKQQGRKIRGIPLQVSEAAHSPLMRIIQKDFASFLDGYQFNDPKIPILLNGTEDLAVSVQQIKEKLISQLVNGINWINISQKMRQMGASDFIEYGAKNVLANFMTRTTPEGIKEQIISLGEVTDFKQLFDDLRSRITG